MKILVTDKINEVAQDILKQEFEVDFLPTMSEDELCKVIEKYDALMIRSQTKVTAKIIESAKNLKIIGRAGVGVDNIDVNSATEKGIIVVNSPEGNTIAAAEHTLAMMLSMARNIPQADYSTRKGNWERSKFTGSEVFNKTLGIIGLGKIGTHVAKVAIALGMKLVVCDPYTSKETVENLGGEYVEKLDDFWAKCDYITLHVPKTKDTANLINAETISKMKQGVKIINCARGGIIDEEALKDAINKGHVSAAAIDVYQDEPDIKKSPLLNVEKNIIMTPHLGASTSEAQLNVAIDVANQIKNVLKGSSASSAVNIPTLCPEKLEPVKDYIQLAENIGEFVQQISKGNLNSIEITVQGRLSYLDVSPLETVILKGIFSSCMEDVNCVNAPLIAKQKGISVKTSKLSSNVDYVGLISVKLNTSEGESSVSGALVTQGVKRIVKIDQYIVSIEPENHMLLIPHEDKLSMVAQVATVIGANGININKMNVNQQPEDYSIMIINVDKKVSDEIISKIEQIDGVYKSKCVSLKG